MNHYPHHIGDRLKDSSHFSLLEHGVHIRLIEVYYTREKPFENAKEAAYLIGARSKPEHAAVASVLRQTFKETDAGWVQTRCDVELSKFKEKAAKASESANARWRKPESQGNTNASTDAMRTHSDGNANQNQNQNQIEGRKKRAAPCPPEFEVTEPMAKWATEQGVAPDRVIPETEKFLDYWRGTGKPMCDWDATWRNWMRRTVESHR